MIIDNELLNKLEEKATANERLRTNMDLRTSTDDTSQRMLNAMLPNTEVPIHRHPLSSENVICLSGRMDEVLYEEVKEFIRTSESDRGMDAQYVMSRKVLREIKRIHLCPIEGVYGCVIPAGVWHTVEIYEPSVIYEAKDGRYGEDGSEIFSGSSFYSSLLNEKKEVNDSLDNLKKDIEYLIGNERLLGNMEELSSSYISKMLNVSIDKVEKCLKNMGL